MKKILNGKTGLLLLLVMASGLWAGQSLSSGTVTRTSLPAYPKNQPYRVEFYLHDWPDTPCQNCRPFESGALGFDAYFTAGPLLVVYSPWDRRTETIVIFLSAFPSRKMYVRYQRDPGAGRIYFEAWDETGRRIINESRPIVDTITTDSTGATASGWGSPLGFVRVHTNLVGLNTRPPVHRDDANRWLEWKFDGNTSDSSGNNYNGSGSSVSYGATANQDAYAVIKANPTSWSNWTTLRAGYPQSLIGSDSYSQADAGAEVTYKWRFVDGPRRAIIDDDTLANPTVTGLVFGTYRFGLEVTSLDGKKNYTELEVGAVAMDDKGVVIPGNPDAERLFGPMIAFGKNPWGYADEAHMRGMRLRNTTYDSISPPVFSQTLPGRVSYNATSNVAHARLAMAIQPNSQTIQVNSTANLTLGSFPTIISLGLPGYGGEEVLICSANGNTLNVCYDGRGWRNTNPRSWGLNQEIYQRRVTGTNTAFLTTVCPAGPGLEGAVRYSAGSVVMTPGSDQVQGINTDWRNANGVFTFLTLRVEGTHGGGQPFVFFAPLSTIQSPTSIQISRPWPADADAGTFSYKMIQVGSNLFSPKWRRQDGTMGQTVLSFSGCMSDTDLYWAGGYEAVTGVNTEVEYALFRDFWMTSGGNGTPNFYDEVLANYSLYYRSGYEPARVAARKLGDYWLKQPLLDEGWAGNFPRNISAAGTVAGAVLDGRTENWYGLRNLASAGVRAIRADCDADIRENGYELMWLAFAAMFDPVDTGSPTEPNQRSYWKAKLDEAYVRDNNCKGADNSFSSGFYFNFGGPVVNVVNGSAAVTGQGLSASLCPQTANGTGTITANMETLTVNGTVPAGQSAILISGMRQGQPYAAKFRYEGSGATIRLAALWPGDSGPVTWMTETDGNITSFSPQNMNSPEYGKVYGCIYNSPTSLTLDRPWEGPTGQAFYYRGNLVGKGQQPFIAGIKALQMKFAGLGASGQTAQNYTSLAASLANWIRDTGYDPDTGGLHYGRVFRMCEPVPKASRPGFDFRSLGCSFGVGRDNKGEARALLAEAQNAVRLVYENDPSATNRDWGDIVYGNQWGRIGFTSPSVPLAEGNIDNVYALDNTLNAGKWYGFQFGIGMAHQWPAVRLGGAQPALLEPLTLTFDGSPYAGATKVVVTLHRPSGEVTQTECGLTSCTVSIDRRQGAHWYQLDFQKTNGESVSRGDWHLYYLP